MILKDILKPGINENRVLITTIISEYFIFGLNTIVSAFYNTLKQLTYLCNYIIGTIKKVVALILIVLT